MYIPSTTPASQIMPETFQYEVFLSHSSKDKPIVRPLAERLRKDGLNVFLDEWEILPGDSIPSKIEQGLEHSRVLVFCMSEHAFGSDWAKLESQTFHFRDPLNKQRRLIPLKLDDVPIKGSLAQFSYIKWFPEDAREHEYLKLLNACRLPAKVSHEPAETVSTIKQANLWNFSHGRNPVFTGRSELLEHVRQDLNANHRQAIYGLGGIGKTQIAVEYAYRHRDDYSDIFWVFADSEQSISTDFIKIAKMLDLPGHDLPEQAVIVGAVRRWLEEKDGWLLVLDNVESAETIRPFLPPQSRGHVLLTSRGHTFQSVGIITPREIKVLPPDAARDFFLRRTGRAGSPDKDTALAGELAKEMGFFPLALEQAGAFIAENQTSFETYLKSYRHRHVELLSEHAPVLGDYKDTVATTWAINFAEVEKSPASADLLRLSAFLWPEMVPLELLEKGASELGERLSRDLASVQTDPLQLDHLLKPLTKYSLISRNPHTRSYSIHLLVQEVLRKRITGEEQRSWIETVVRVVNVAFPEGEFKNWPECERLLSQALVCKTYIFESHIESPAAADLLRHTGFYLHNRAQFSQAQGLYQAALAMRQKIYGVEHPDTADSLGKLGVIYLDQARYKDAEDMLSRAFEIREKVLGPEHPDTATSANDLAELYLTIAKYGKAELLLRRALSVREKVLGPAHAQIAESLSDLAHLLLTEGKYDEAEPLYRQALAIRENAYGPEHPDTAASLGNLADLFNALGKYSDAEPLYRRALVINENALGSEHPDTAVGLNNLAGLFHEQAKYNEAEPLYRRALAVYEKVHGPEHPRTATSLNLLAGLLIALGKYSEAEPLHRRALTIYEQAVGPEHPKTSGGLNHLAELLGAQGKYSEAEPLSRRALEIDEKAMGLDHPDTATGLNNLASVVAVQGRYSEAEPLHRRALAIHERVLGPEHPRTATTLNNLARLLQDQGKYSEAEPLYRRALAIEEKTLGPEHPTTSIGLNNLAELLREQRKYNQAEPLYHRVLQIREKVLGPEHPSTGIGLNNLALLLQAQKKHDAAEPLYRRCYAIDEKALGPEHPSTATGLCNLAALLQARKKYDEAEPLYRRALTIDEMALGSQHPHTATALNSLASLLADRGKYSEAEPLFRRALAIRQKVFGPSHPAIADSVFGLASLYRLLGNNKKAKGFEQRAKKIMRKKR
jgi:tetratricopeptide (TPR) repeat protein